MPDPFSAPRDAGELAAELAAARNKLSAARRLRVRPKRDEKVLVCWNSLAIEAMARAGAALGEPRVPARPPLPRPNSCWPACARPRAGSCTAGAGVAKHNAYLDNCAGLAAARWRLAIRSP